MENDYLAHVLSSTCASLTCSTFQLSIRLLYLHPPPPNPVQLFRGLKVILVCVPPGSQQPPSTTKCNFVTFLASSVPQDFPNVKKSTVAQKKIENNWSKAYAVNLPLAVTTSFSNTSFQPKFTNSLKNLSHSHSTYYAIS